MSCSTRKINLSKQEDFKKEKTANRVEKKDDKKVEVKQNNNRQKIAINRVIHVDTKDKEFVIKAKDGTQIKGKGSVSIKEETNKEFETLKKDSVFIYKNKVDSLKSLLKNENSISKNKTTKALNFNFLIIFIVIGVIFVIIYKKK